MSLNPEAIIGCILGTAVGDALGLPYEGLHPTKIKTINGYRLFFGKGMVSDDTEHTCMLAQALIVSAGDKKLFLEAFAWRLRWWLLSLPAGVGYGTLRAILKLWFGFAPIYSGVKSAGNGTVMRAALLGVCYGHDLTKLTSLVKFSTVITHTDPKAEYATLAVAIAAYLSSQDMVILPQYYVKTLESILPANAEELISLMRQAGESAYRQEDSQIFAASLGLTQGVTGYVYHTVPVVVQIWLRHQENYPLAIKEVIKLGGDTDTTAAILGAIIGARVGKKGIPSPWLRNLGEYPRTVQWIENLGLKLAQVCTTGDQDTALPLPIIPLIIRNLFFLLIVIIYRFYRLFVGKL
jgi:ADP-ribosylglycohydrolase